MHFNITIVLFSNIKYICKVIVFFQVKSVRRNAHTNLLGASLPKEYAVIRSHKKILCSVGHRKAERCNVD